MCLILAAKKNIKLKKDFLNHCFEQNPEGAGMAYVDNGKVILKKPFWTLESFWEYYSTVMDKIEYSSPVLLHMRVSSGSRVIAANTMPFRISKNLVFAHNGNLENFGIKGDKNKSDTRVFVKDVLTPLISECPDVYKSPSFTYLLKCAFGDKNRMAFMDSSGEFYIINEFYGEWVTPERNIWASNDTFRFRRTLFGGLSPDRSSRERQEARQRMWEQDNWDGLEEEARLESDYSSGLINEIPECSDGKCGECQPCLMEEALNKLDEDDDPDWSVPNNIEGDLEQCCLCKQNVFEAVRISGAWYCEECRDSMSSFVNLANGTGEYEHGDNYYKAPNVRQDNGFVPSKRDNPVNLIEVQNYF